MDNKRKNIILLSVLVVVFILMVIFISVEFFGSDDVFDILLINSKKENDIQENMNNKSDNNNSADEDVVTSDDENIIIDDNKSQIEDTFGNENNLDYTEEEVVSYFENIGNEVEESISFKEKFKEYFINVVDFIFYDKEINGYTFSELSGTAKVKVISIALKIDNKIEEYIPGYKETISNASSKIYTNIKEKLITLYMDVSTDICKDNEKECDKVKEIFSDIKDSCKIGWDFFKGLVGDGFSKVKEWYEIYSGK